MKKNYFSVALALGTLLTSFMVCGLQAQAEGSAVTIDEEHFPNYWMRQLAKQYDIDNDDVLSAEEILVIKSIGKYDFNSANDLTGIGYFTELESLECYNLTIKELDLSGNKKLKNLDCSGNMLDTLDLSQNTELESIKCGFNYLKELDLSHQTKLVDLECAGTLDKLVLPKTDTLKKVDCKGTYLKTLDLSMYTNLEALNISESRLAAIDLSHNQKLVNFEADSIVSLAKFEMSGFTVEGLDVSKISDLQGASISANGFLIPDSENETITYHYDAQNGRAGMISVCLLNDYSVPNDMAHFDDDMFRYYIYLTIDKNRDYILSSDELYRAKKIDISTLNVYNLKGLEYFCNLESLDCSQVRCLEELDVSKNPNLKRLDCSLCTFNDLVLDNEKLEYLNCGSTPLGQLDVSKCSALQELFCSACKLSGLDLTQNKELRILSVGANKIQYLNTSLLPKLQDLYCDNNQMAYLDVSNCKVLEKLSCKNNAQEVYWAKNGIFIPGLEASRVKNLKGATINAYGMLIPDPDAYKIQYSYDTGFTGEGKLVDFELFSDSYRVEISKTNFPDKAFREYVSEKCDKDNDNQLSIAEIKGVFSINVRRHNIEDLTGLEIFENLTSLDCSNNPIKKLDVSGMKKLQSLECNDTSILYLNLEGLDKLSYLNCRNCGRVFASDENGVYVKELDLSRVEIEEGGTIRSDGLIVLDEGSDGILYHYDTKTTSEMETVDALQEFYIVLQEPIDEHTHVFEDNWSSDETYHWHQCMGCPEMEDVSLHVYETVTKPATTSKDGSITKKCSECGYVASTKTIASVKSVKLKTTSYVYDGKAKNPSVEVLDKNGNKVSTKYYEVKLSDGRKAVGEYKVSVTFKGNYKGSKSLSFTILPKGTELKTLTAQSKGFTASWGKVTKETTGYELRYDTSAKMKNPKTVTMTKNTTVSKKITKLDSKKKYYVQIRTYKKVGSKKYYSDWSKTLNVVTKK